MADSLYPHTQEEYLTPFRPWGGKVLPVSSLPGTELNLPPDTFFPLSFENRGRKVGGEARTPLVPLSRAQIQPALLSAASLATLAGRNDDFLKLREPRSQIPAVWTHRRADTRSHHNQHTHRNTLTSTSRKCPQILTCRHTHMHTFTCVYSPPPHTHTHTP